MQRCSSQRAMRGTRSVPWHYWDERMELAAMSGSERVMMLRLLLA